MSDAAPDIIGTITVKGAPVETALHLESVVQDLRFARNALAELAAHPVTWTERQPIEEVDPTAVALWMSAAIAYGRCFKQGARYPVGQTLVPAEEDLRTAHRDLVGMRDEHLAHLTRNSEHERLEATVVVKQPVGDGLPITFQTEGIKVLLPSPTEQRRYTALVETVLASAESARDAAIGHVGELLVASDGGGLITAARSGRTIRL